MIKAILGGVVSGLLAAAGHSWLLLAVMAMLALMLAMWLSFLRWILGDDDRSRRAALVRAGGRPPPVEPADARDTGRTPRPRRSRWWRRVLGRLRR